MVRKKKVVIGSGAGAVEPGVDLVNNDFESFTIADPITLGDYRAMVGNSSISPVRTYLSVQDTGAPFGKAVTWHSPANTVGTNENGGIGAQSNLSQTFNDGYIEFWIRFRQGWEWSLGGKIPGLGGFVPGSAVPNGPSGGNPHWFGWGGRFMWGPQGSLRGYTYFPWLAYNVFGKDRLPGYNFPSLPGDTAHSNGDWVKLKRRYKMNTTYNTGVLTTDSNIWTSATAAGTLDTAQRTATEGVDYEADGWDEIYVNDVLMYSKYDEVWQFYYNPTGGIRTIQYSQFRGGQGTTWMSSIDGYCDIANMHIRKLG